MNNFEIQSHGASETFADGESLISRLGAILNPQEALSFALPKMAVQTLRGVRGLFREHGIEIVLMADSTPDAMDYLAQMGLGAAAGAVGGSVGGVWALALLSRAGYLIPGVGWFLTAASVLGVVVGALTGFAVTRMGLRVRFRSAETMQFELLPVQQ